MDLFHLEGSSMIGWIIYSVLDNILCELSFGFTFARSLI
jgi:hypothetical protein